jgi:preprotein translocase SecE subunit
MATAVEPGSEPRTPSAPSSLQVASLLGAIYIIAMLAIVFYALPSLWVAAGGERFRIAEFDVILGCAQLAAGLTLLWFGRKLLGDSPPKGVRAGIFLVLVLSTLIFFVWRAVAINVEGMPGMIFSGAIAAVLLFFAVRFFTGKTGASWMVGLEEQGWFHGSAYKRSLGQRVRRLTILGILLLGISGVYSLMFQGVLPNDWVLTMPFDMQPVMVMANARDFVPVLLMALTLWIAYRVVNVPSFAEFLIATEAEMNKVSWTSKKRLAQDTVVVLTTTLLMALFLLVVDLFWGWLLSNKYVGVLPVQTAPEKSNQVQQAKW